MVARDEPSRWQQLYSSSSLNHVNVPTSNDLPYNPEIERDDESITAWLETIQLETIQSTETVTSLGSLHNEKNNETVFISTSTLL